MPHTLYLCYFGVREPLVQTQVLPYLRELAAGGVKVSLLTFEPDFKKKWSAEQISVERATLAAQGISWHVLPYHKSPSVPATFYDVMNGARFIVSLMRREGIDVLHARAHIPMMMALLVKNVLKQSCRIIFDIRGLVADEYADAGVWREGSAPFRAIKKIERIGIRQADQIVVLTRKMKNYLIANYARNPDSIEVVPCCVDFSRLNVNSNYTAPERRRFTLIYAGSVTGLYLLEEMGLFFLALKKQLPDVFFQILTKGSVDAVAKVFQGIGIESQDFAIQSVNPAEVMNLVSQADLAISFRKPTFSQIAASPTKIPEYLACGIPVVANAGIGDMDELLESVKVGVVLKDFARESLAEAAANALELVKEPNLKKKCVETALKHFDLKLVGKTNYLKVYNRILSPQGS
jgi:glycosyltransferase involved in cell wall biosynthesis